LIVVAKNNSAQMSQRKLPTGRSSSAMNNRLEEKVTRRREASCDDLRRDELSVYFVEASR
jgi:hypothetical protein